MPHDISQPNSKVVYKSMQQDLFSSNSASRSRPEPSGESHKNAPLAHLARPTKLEDLLGQEHIFKNAPYLTSGKFPGIILWGPPGSGKTTLAGLISKLGEQDFYQFNAVLGGINDLKKIIKTVTENRSQFQREAIIFIDEIHRFNKAQQDALLPYVESGEFTLIGATTENPKVSINRALLSRLKVITLNALDQDSLFKILENANAQFNLNIGSESLEIISRYSAGDARLALNTLEEISLRTSTSTEELRSIILAGARNYDKNGDRHYDVISAFIKSMRGSDPNAAILWLAVMIDGGEDPVFIARRLVIFASEDVGNADPQALTLAISTLQAVEKIGMPEARINLGHTTSYLASTFKSPASYQAIDAALQYVKDNATIEVPSHLKNFPPPEAAKYLYPHAYSHSFVEQIYSPIDTPSFYQPTENGKEREIKKHLKKLWGEGKF